ncbi:hypothetical protein Clacol_005044 [Clathrus columnatus]|uniref:Uncharacterized protein n=1 Tax=Clathrus columnatus TaxID=1419009 RepID=A0AAV5A860_9AGAM|nr:hypothetical protein Clacol_005044 [Clathrus columnatus]
MCARDHMPGGTNVTNGDEVVKGDNDGGDCSDEDNEDGSDGNAGNLTLPAGSDSGFSNGNGNDNNEPATVTITVTASPSTQSSTVDSNSNLSIITNSTATIAATVPQTASREPALAPNVGLPTATSSAPPHQSPPFQPPHPPPQHLSQPPSHSTRSTPSSSMDGSNDNADSGSSNMPIHLSLFTARFVQPTSVVSLASVSQSTAVVATNSSDNGPSSYGRYDMVTVLEEWVGHGSKDEWGNERGYFDDV